MPQEFGLLDYLAPVIVGIIFAISVLIISCISNFFCINKNDEITKFEEFGARLNFRMGRPLRTVKKMIADRMIDDDDDHFKGEKTLLTE